MHILLQQPMTLAFAGVRPPELAVVIFARHGEYSREFVADSRARAAVATIFAMPRRRARARGNTVRARPRGNVMTRDYGWAAVLDCWLATASRRTGDVLPLAISISPICWTLLWFAAVPGGWRGIAGLPSSMPRWDLLEMAVVLRRRLRPAANGCVLLEKMPIARELAVAVELPIQSLSSSTMCGGAKGRRFVTVRRRSLLKVTGEIRGARPRRAGAVTCQIAEMSPQLNVAAPSTALHWQYRGTAALAITRAADERCSATLGYALQGRWISPTSAAPARKPGKAPNSPICAKAR